MTKTVGELDFPLHGFLETRRGPIVEIALSNAPMQLARTYVLVPDGAGELPAGIYSTSVKQVIDLDGEQGWMVEVDLEPEARDSPVRSDATLDDEWEADERDLIIASRREWFLPQEPAPEREGDQPVNPYGLWALDEAGDAFLVEVEADDEGALWVEAATRYGKSLHPFAYPATMPAGSEDDAEALAAGQVVARLDVATAGAGGEPQHERWTVGKRRAIEAAAGRALPEFDPGQWMRWLTPVGGGDPVAFGGFLFPEGRAIELQPVMPVEPEWAVGRVLTIPMPRPGVAFEDAREVTVYGKAFKELRSSVTKIRRRPPTPIGRFMLEAEGFMPGGWSALG